MGCRSEPSPAQASSLVQPGAACSRPCKRPASALLPSAPAASCAGCGARLPAPRFGRGSQSGWRTRRTGPQCRQTRSACPAAPGRRVGRSEGSGGRSAAPGLLHGRGAPMCIHSQQQAGRRRPSARPAGVLPACRPTHLSCALQQVQPRLGGLHLAAHRSTQLRLVGLAGWRAAGAGACGPAAPRISRTLERRPARKAKQRTAWRAATSSRSAPSRFRSSEVASRRCTSATAAARAACACSAAAIAEAAAAAQSERRRRSAGLGWRKRRSVKSLECPSLSLWEAWEV